MYLINHADGTVYVGGGRMLDSYRGQGLAGITSALIFKHLKSFYPQYLFIGYAKLSSIWETKIAKGSGTIIQKNVGIINIIMN